MRVSLLLIRSMSYVGMSIQTENIIAVNIPLHTALCCLQEKNIVQDRSNVHTIGGSL